MNELDVLRQKLKDRALGKGLTHVADEVGLSRQALHAFLSGGDIKLSNLSVLLNSLGFEVKLLDTVSDEDVRYSLSEYGASLVASQGALKLPLEETIVRALDVCRDDLRVSYVLPQVLIKQAYRFDQKLLLEQLGENEEALQLLGYHLQVALEFRYRAPLNKLLKKVRLLCPHPESLYLRRKDQARLRKHFQEVSNPAADSWNILTRENLAGLRNRLQRWERMNEAS